MLKNNNYNPDVLTCLANLSSDEVFTPPQLANQVLNLLPKELWSDKNIRFLDPCCKSGVFLREIVKRLDKGLEKEIPNKEKRIEHILKNQVFGIAITELTALFSRRSVYCSKKANGKYSVCDSFKDEQGNIIFKRIEHTWENGQCVFCGANKEIYDRGGELETHAYQFIHTKNPEEVFKMKFDVIIGNPPYQLRDSGAGASAIPLYHKFVQQAKKLNPRYLTMIIPSRWFAGGKGLDKFRDEMLNDNKISVIVDYISSKECFPGVSIGGGVCYFLWERDFKGLCKVTNVLNEKKQTLIRRLNEFPIFVRDNKAIEIIRKIKKKNEKDVSSIVYSRNPFGLSSSVRGKEHKFIGCVTLHSSEGLSYIKSSEVSKSNKYVSKYKVMISKVTSEHAGEPDRNSQFKVISNIKILKPNEVCTDSYLIACDSDSFNFVNNFYNYLKTKFARYLLLQAVTSINLSKDKFVFIPIQDFKQSWEDVKLYKKYGLTKEEISFIESMIRPME